jgi:hypothetical protein
MRDAVESRPGAPHRAFAPGTAAARPVASGVVLVVGLLTLALGLAVFAVWFQWQQTRRCLDFYGAATARAIQAADRVELWERVPPAADGPATVRRLDVTWVRGLVHLRRGLVEDANLDWHARRPDEAAGAGIHNEAMADPALGDLAIAFYADVDAASPDAVLLIDRAAGVSGMLAVQGQPGKVGLGRLRAGLDAWLGSARLEGVSVDVAGAEESGGDGAGTPPDG